MNGIHVSPSVFGVTSCVNRQHMLQIYTHHTMLYRSHGTILDVELGPLVSPR